MDFVNARSVPNAKLILPLSTLGVKRVAQKEIKVKKKKRACMRRKCCYYKSMDYRLNNPEFRTWLKIFGIDPDICEIDLTLFELNELWEEFQDGT